MPYKNIEINPAQYSSTNIKQKDHLYIGYSSINAPSTGNTELYDSDLIRQDLLNQFNTKLGERVMNPTFGTIIWSLLFEPFTDDIKQAILNDVNRICNFDPRVVPTQINVSEQDSGILLEVSLQYVGTNQVITMQALFDSEIGIITQ